MPEAAYSRHAQSFSATIRYIFVASTLLIIIGILLGLYVLHKGESKKAKDKKGAKPFTGYVSALPAKKKRHFFMHLLFAVIFMSIFLLALKAFGGRI